MKSERSSFWKLQAEWHGNIDPSAVLDRHRIREKYYDWYTQNWLIDDKARPVLDLACGAGGFVYFLTQRGYSNVVGIDLDEVQVAVASGLGLDCRCEGISDHLAGVKEGACGLISALDILEHFTSEELSDTLDAISKALAPDGKFIVSVPNAESPRGFATRHADITHETAFSEASLAQLFLCHGLMIKEIRDPWPAPISFARKIYRCIAIMFRKIEAVRFRLLGLSPIRYWSPVIWVVAEKVKSNDLKTTISGSGGA